MESRRTLEGIKVVELSTFVAAPVCARMLVDLGAEVVKTDTSFPMYSPTEAGDTFTETVLFSGILAALYQREKTGRGDCVTAALQNAGMWFMASMLIQAQEKYHIKFPKERKDCSPFALAYKCADGEWTSITILDMDRLMAAGAAQSRGGNDRYLCQEP